jgi:tetratricopeptide (TPR) repeat protein
MLQQMQSATAKPESESTMLFYVADSAAYSGQISRARDLFQEAVTSAEQAKQKEKAADYDATAAVQEAFFGNAAQARKHAANSLAFSNGRDAEYPAALALAVAGDSSRAQALADDLAQRFSEDTVVRFVYLPTLRAQLAFNRGETWKAVEFLEPAATYELGVPGPTTFANNLYSIYVRGQAYLRAGQGADAAAQFQKIIDSRGLVVNDPVGALAPLGLARAYTVSGDQAKAKAAYQDFFQLWKDADADIPILKQARVDYAKLL